MLKRKLASFFRRIYLYPLKNIDFKLYYFETSFTNTTFKRVSNKK